MPRLDSMRARLLRVEYSDILQVYFREQTPNVSFIVLIMIMTMRMFVAAAVVVVMMGLAIAHSGIVL